MRMRGRRQNGRRDEEGNHDRGGEWPFWTEGNAGWKEEEEANAAVVMANDGLPSIQMALALPIPSSLHAAVF